MGESNNNEINNKKISKSKSIILKHQIIPYTIKSNIRKNIIQHDLYEKLSIHRRKIIPIATIDQFSTTSTTNDNVNVNNNNNKSKHKKLILGKYNYDPIRNTYFPLNSSSTSTINNNNNSKRQNEEESNNNEINNK